METFRTKPAPHYLPPTAEEMKEAARRVDLRSYSKDLVADLVNLASGGKLVPPSEYRDAVRRKEEDKLPSPNSLGKWYIGKGVADNRSDAITLAAENAMKYHQNVCDFLQTVDISQFPGPTPLAQAMALLKMLSKQKGGNGGGEDGEPLPIFQEGDASGVAKQMHDALHMAANLEEIEREMLDAPPQESESDLQALQVASDMMSGENKRLILDISRKLDQLSKMNVRKQVRPKADPAGGDIRQRPMKNLSELGKIAKPAWALRSQNPSYFLYKAVTGQLPVRERIVRTEKKQILFILVDGSGSMQGSRHLKATGVVMNRLKAVHSGDAVVFLSVFDTSLGKMSKAETPQEASEMVKQFHKGNFTGGGTDIAAAVKAAHQKIEEMIKNGEALYRPEIVVLTDDDTSVSALKPSDISGTRVHGFAMECANTSLVALAKATGGVGIDHF